MRMKPFLAALVVITLIFATTGVPACWAQLPLGDELQVNEGIDSYQKEPVVAAAADGSFAVSFADYGVKGEPSISPFLAVRFYGPAGTPLSDVSYPEVNPLLGVANGSIRLWPRRQGGYGLLAVKSCAPESSPRCFGIRYYDQRGRLVGEPLSIGPVDGTFEAMGYVTARSTASGRLVLGWVRDETEANAALFDARTGGLGPPFFRTKDPQGGPPGGFTFDLDARGNVLAVWSEGCGPFLNLVACDVFAQRFSRSGMPLGGRMTVTGAQGNQWVTSVSSAPSGKSLVVWEEVEPLVDNRTRVHVEARIVVPAEMSRLGRAVRLGSRGDVLGLSAAAADPFDNFAVVWSSFGFEPGSPGWDIVGRLVDTQGRTVGKSFRINSTATSTLLAGPRAAFGGNGTLVVVWNGNDGSFDGVFGQRFLASPADEPCVLRAGRLLCDGGRSGGPAELDRAVAAGFVLGDADGDGRKDLCSFAAGELRCEIDPHDVQAPAKEVRLKFGAAGDLPLFGDVDGDGREEPCVRRGRLHLCDTGHNGGRAETTFQVGEAGDEPLLGDLDGDGRDDACVFSRGRFLCDLHRAGRKPVTILFGEAGDSPALGDYDGDGDDDPCVLRAGLILCDLAHDGGEAEAVLEFGQTGDRLLIGNLDGL